MICEKCWSEAARQSFNTGRSQTDCYKEILERKTNRPCTFIEQLIGKKINLKPIEDCIEIASIASDYITLEKARETLFNLQTLLGNIDERIDCHAEGGTLMADKKCIFSGKDSQSLWDDINAVKNEAVNKALYHLGCKCQELEVKIDTALKGGK